MCFGRRSSKDVSERTQARPPPPAPSPAVPWVGEADVTFGSARARLESIGPKVTNGRVSADQKLRSSEEPEEPERSLVRRSSTESQASQVSHPPIVICISLHHSSSKPRPYPPPSSFPNPSLSPTVIPWPMTGDDDRPKRKCTETAVPFYSHLQQEHSLNPLFG